MIGPPSALNKFLLDFRPITANSAI